MWSVNEYGIKLSVNRATSFLGEGLVPAPEYPDTPKMVGSPLRWGTRGAIANCAAVA